MITLHKSPLMSENGEHADGAREIVATLGDRAVLKQKLFGYHEEWQRGDGPGRRIIDGKPYVRVAGPVESEEA